MRGNFMKIIFFSTIFIFIILKLLVFINDNSNLKHNIIRELKYCII